MVTRISSNLLSLNKLFWIWSPHKKTLDPGTKIQEQVVYLGRDTRKLIDKGRWDREGFVIIVQSLSHAQLFATPWTEVHQAPLSMEGPRKEYWIVISFSRGSSQPMDWTHISCIAGEFFTTEPPLKSHDKKGRHLIEGVLLTKLPLGDLSFIPLGNSGQQCNTHASYPAQGGKGMNCLYPDSQTLIESCWSMWINSWYFQTAPVLHQIPLSNQLQELIFGR